MAAMHNIFLIGLPGSGKSSIGRILAQRLNKPFFDIDTLIERECGERISTIFEHYGEEYFRLCESRLLAQVAQSQENAVIATGGGVVTKAENRSLIRSHGISVYLMVDSQTALDRLNRQHLEKQAQGEVLEIRPLLVGSNPLKSLQTLLQDRSKWYENAHFTCSTLNKSIERIAQEIIALLISSGELVGEPPILEVQRIHVDKGYNAIVEWGGLGRLPQHLKKLDLPPRVFLITDSNIHNLYASMIMGTLSSTGFEPQMYTVPAGEASKSQEQLNALYDWLIKQRVERGEAIIALGGGMVGDLAGYAAATYLRGVPLVQVPTSLLAQVDSAIGGKTGINHAMGKNLIGAFYHPRLVLIDPATLLTLPTRERTEGWAEVVKYGIILDTELFARLEEYADTLREFTHPPATLLCQIIMSSIALKAAIIEEDEREQGRRTILNYGHTVAHALENVAGYGELLHGEAVSLGMVVAGCIAQQAGLFSEGELVRQNTLLEAFGLPTSYAGSVPVKNILSAIQLDKKVAGKQVRWVLPRRIGDVTVTPMPNDLVERVITAFFVEKRP
ncbi:MAG: 3-dehydroquinate synthase [Chloroflexi bacterium]|nr:MAG: 3-dehydroquinate synthase [Chloroflexota bacterium]